MWAPVLQNNGRTPVDAVDAVRAGDLRGAVPRRERRRAQHGQRDPGRKPTRRSGPSYRFSTVRITSTTPVADIQLAQTLPNGRLLVVFSVYTDTEHEYEAAVVDPSGALVDQFALPAADWAQSMPLSRFRLVGSSLYELGSTEARRLRRSLRPGGDDMSNRSQFRFRSATRSLLSRDRSDGDGGQSACPERPVLG